MLGLLYERILKCKIKYFGGKQLKCAVREHFTPISLNFN